jgi:gliding motility-associated-like protein
MHFIRFNVLSMKKFYSFITLFIVALLPLSAQAQITVQSNATAAAMASMLVGGGVVVLNPTMTCHDSAKGIFRGVSTLGFDSGVVLTSGRSNNNSAIPFPNTGVNGPASIFASTSWSLPGDPTLATLTPLTLHDACVLEFDFRPTGDTVKFDYRWGSEEYTSYACSGSFNDVFGFFISGPGYASPTNIAKVPGTNIPVCINSINCGATGGNPLSNCTALGPGSPFCAYYVNNSSGTTITYDGLTTILKAVASVTPCDTYHLKMGVADASDWSFDSGVFLKAGSLTSTSIHVTPVGTNPLDTATGVQYCVRGCLPGKFVFSRGGAGIAATTIKFLISGTATNGVDYSFIADSVVIPAGGTSATVFINGLPIAPPVGPKTVKVYILSAVSCGGTTTIADSAMITIYDSFAVKILTTDTAICLGQFINASAFADPSLDLHWTASPPGSISNDTMLNPVLTPTTNTTYVLTGQYPSPGCNPSKDVLNVTVYPPPSVFVGDPIKKTCVGQNPPLPVTVTSYPPASYYSYSWTASPSSALSWLSSPTSANPTISPTNTNSTPSPISPIDTGNVTFTVTVGVNGVAVGCKTTQTFQVHIEPNDFWLYCHDSDVCYPATAFQINADGASEFDYLWNPTEGVSDPHIINPTITPLGVGLNSYTLTATSSLPGCAPMSHPLTYKVIHPEVHINTGHHIGKGDTTICPTLAMPIEVTYPGGTPDDITWTPDDGSLTDIHGATPNFFNLTPGTYTYYVTIVDGPGCTDMDSVKITVSPPVRITASPNSYGYDSALIMLGQTYQLDCKLLSSDPVYYYWRPNDGTLNDPNINNPVAKPSETTMYTVYAMNMYGCRDTANIKIIVDPGTDEFVPSAFTPNGDGLNDIFRVNLKFQKLVDFRVYNRWGQMVFENTSADAKKGWDGTVNGVPQDMGVYHYSIMVQKPSGEKKLYNGDVTLIR